MRLPKVYEPGQYERDIYGLWETNQAFVPKNRGREESYSVVIPPPNANGNLHMGHGLTLAIEDIATRYHRMKGEATLLLPGADHAGFETQVVYEKHLAKEGKSRFDLSREELYKQVWDFVQLNKGNFEQQLRQMGISCDWSRFTFTLDEKIIKTAYATFKRMWDDGLIYRGERLVNFCTHHGTAFADIEVEHKEEKGKLWHIRYPLVDGSGEIVVATTRPETMLGDTAVAVHPSDKRYAKMVGKTVKLPLTHREIPIIADDMVDKSFGSGAVKITPAHDPNDFAVAERHDLPMISVINHEGSMSHEAGESYVNLPVREARQKVVNDLQDQGFLLKTEDHTHSVGHCYKCGTVIEPLLRDQWFIDMQPLAKEAIKVLKAKKIKFYPEAKRDQLVRYLQGLKDWNISRQIAWGIPIPAFQNADDPDDWIYDERVGEETISVDGKTYHRDPDVFDTWFSSGQWPFATLDYPDGQDFKQFYPLSLMETGGEILQPWVSRMIMLGLYITGEIPFEAVYIHGYVMAEDGAKMSKSVGNVVDPLPVIEKYGSDALRIGIIANRAPAVNRGYDQAKVEGGRNFCNKLWNVARFVEDAVGPDTHLRHTPKPQTLADYWMLSKLQQSIHTISSALDEYKFAEAYDCVHRLVWDDVADWYIEASKSTTNRSVLGYVLETILKLAHPFAPFVTETIWQTLEWEQSMLATETWPEPPKTDEQKSAVFNTIIALVREIRQLSRAMELTRPRVYLGDNPVLIEQAELIRQLAKTGDVIEGQPDDGGVHLSATPFDAWLDVDTESITAYVVQLTAAMQDQKQRISGLKQRLANKQYVQNAPQKIVQQTQDELTEQQQLLAERQSELKRFE